MIQKAIWMKAAAAVMGAVVVTGTVIAVTRLSDKEESYRSIQIYELEGTAQIHREETGTIDALENLYLESGDQLAVEPASFTRLRLDEDKYVMVEENSRLSIEAAGNKEESRTTIHLTQGAMVNEIKNPLSANSSYEVTTPNSIMAVRGTIFRVEIFRDEKGELYTKLCVFEGHVASRLIYPDGTMAGEVMTDGGREVIIHSNEHITEYLGEAAELRYEELPLEALYALAKMLDEGSALEGITREELARIIDGLEKAGEPEAEKENSKEEETEVRETSETTEQGKTAELPETTEPPEDTESSEAITVSGEPESQRTVQEIQTESSPVPETLEGAVTEAETVTEETTIAPEETLAPEKEEETTPYWDYDDNSDDEDYDDYPGGSGGGGGGSTPTESTQETSATEAPTEAPTEPATEPTTEPATKPAEPMIYTVTFMYNGAEFATQQVNSGECAEEPWLSPANSGSWSFDFAKEITGDTVIEWN